MITQLQDIHLTEVQFWQAVQLYWNQQNYEAIINLIETNQQIITKYANAEWFNKLTNLIYTLENYNDDDFKSDKIKVGYLPPDLEIDEIFFQIEIGDLLINFYLESINTGSTSKTINYEGTLINAITFKNNQVVITDISIDEVNQQVTFSIGKAIDNPVLCAVYSTTDTNVHVASDELAIGDTVKNIYFGNNNTVLSTIYTENSYIENVDITYTTDTIIFNLQDNATIAGIARVVYVNTSYLSNVANISQGSLTSTNTELLLLCDGYPVNFITQTTGGGVIITDILLLLNQAIFSIAKQGTTVNCTIFYIN